MEQLINPKAMIATAMHDAATSDIGGGPRSGLGSGGTGPITHTPQLYPVAADPARAWLRLTEVQIPASAPIRDQTDDAGRAAIDLLRSRIMRQIRRDGLRRLALTAPTHGCGTSLIAACLALSLSKRMDLKVLLFDMNLRAPMLAQLFGLKAVAPRQSVLAGVRRSFDTDCLRIGHNLGLGLSTQAELSPAELLGSTRSAALLNQIEEDFDPDLILYDMPPVLPNDDVVAAADLYDAALLVARADHSALDQIDRAERLIGEQKPCLGVIMNACRFPTQSELGDERPA